MIDVGVKFLTVTTVTMISNSIHCLPCENEFFWHFTWYPILACYACTTKASWYHNLGAFELCTNIAFQHDIQPYQKELVQLATGFACSVFSVAGFVDGLYNNCGT